MSRAIDNNGIGALYATFDIMKEYPLTIKNVGDAVTMIGNNTIGHGRFGDRLVGRLEHVSGGLATVQVGGVIRVNYKTEVDRPYLNINDKVLISGNGNVIPPSDLDRLTSINYRGLVISIDPEYYTCDMLI